MAKTFKILFIITFVAMPFIYAYTLQSYVISGGGTARSTTTGYIMGASVHQHFISRLTSSNYTAYIGFWPPWGSMPGIEEQEQFPGPGQAIIFTLGQNYPNPVRASTTIKYSIPNTGRVQLRFYDVAGREVATLIDKNQPAGHYALNWNINNVDHSKLANGIYFYRLIIDEYIDTKKMAIIR